MTLANASELISIQEFLLLLILVTFALRVGTAEYYDAAEENHQFDQQEDAFLAVHFDR
jgi:hypothetical protein